MLSEPPEGSDLPPSSIGSDEFEGFDGDFNTGHAWPLTSSHPVEMIDPQLEDMDATLSYEPFESQATETEPLAIDEAENIWAIETLLAVWPGANGMVRYLVK